jgi:hypothetical protein
MSGWIKIYRKIQDSDMYKQLNSKQRDVMVQCLLLANHKEITWEWQGDFITCHPGQFITSLQNLKKVCAKDVSIQNIRTALGKLKKWQFLTIKSTKTGRLVTVLNWVSYQQDDIDNQQSNQQRANKELTTNKNVKNVKNTKRKTIKKKNLSDFAYKIADEFHDYQMKNCPVASIKNWNRENWADTIDKLMRIDGYKQQTISDALGFAVSDDFWSKQIISLAGLRKKGKNDLTKFDNLVIRMERNR